MTEEQQSIPVDDEPEAARRRRGCVRPVVWTLLIVAAVVLLLAVGVWFYTGTSSFEDLVARRIETTLESRMGREVLIGNIEIERGRVTSVILEDVKIENAEGATHPWFAIVPRLVIEGGVESFRQRVVQVGRIQVIDPEVFIEIFPEGSPLTHNFPEWKRGEPSRFEIAKIEMSEIEINGGRFVYLDHRRELEADLGQITAKIEPNMDENVFSGIVIAETGTISYRDWKPFEASIRTGFRFADRQLTLKGTKVRSDRLTVDLGGTIETRDQVSYDLSIDGRTSLVRVADILGLDQPMEGALSFDTRLQGVAGDFELTGSLSSEAISVTGYDLRDLQADLNFTDQVGRVEIERARYGGGTVSGTWRLTTYDDPLPMVVDLDYDAVSFEALLADWNVESSGLRGAASGSIHYEFVRDDILGGDGSGAAVLQPGTVAFGDAPHPMPLSGRTEFGIADGVLRFRDPSVLRIPETVVRFSGTLGIEELRTDLSFRIESEDFSVLDRLGVNFGRALGSEDFELLGLGGSGSIDGTLEGTLDEPVVTLSIASVNTRYNDIDVGSASIDLTWTGSTGTLDFDQAEFSKGTAELQLDGRIRFPDDGEPVFDLEMIADSWPVQEAIDLVDLELDGTGLATGRMTVDGTPERGRVRFDDLAIRTNGSRLALSGLVNWLPGEGNVAYDLDIGAESFPIADVVAFLDLGELPVEGDLTGTLHIEGLVEELEGAGSVTVRNGAISGEPIEEAVADLRFDQGTLDVSHFQVTAPAGVLTGLASYDFDTKEFSYLLQPTTIDLSKVELLHDFDLIDGQLQITSSGAGTAESPEIVLEATLVDGSILGTPLPAEASPPRFYLGIRDGDLVIRGSALDTLTVIGEGRVAEGGALSGNVSIEIADLRRLMSIVAPDSDVAVEGSLVADLDLGGTIGSLETLEIDGKLSRFDLEVGGKTVEAPEPIRFALSNGKLAIDSALLRAEETDFLVNGTIGLTGDQILDLDINGEIDLALVQLFVGDATTRGAVVVQADVGGTLENPRIRGTAEIRDGSLKLAAFPQLISNIYGSFILRGDRVDIDAFQANLGGGSIVAGGFVTLQGLKPGRIRINTRGEDVTIRSFEGVTLTSDFDLVLSGDVERLLLQGDLIVDRAIYYEDFDLTQLILQKVLERQAIVPDVAATWQDDVALRISVSANDTLAIQNNVADLTGSADLQITGSLANPIILGRIFLNEGGSIEFQDVDYRLVQGSVSFQNPFRNDPYFDITAEGVLKSRGQSLGEIEEYELTVNLTGTLDRMTPNISSDPPVGDLTLLTLLSGNVGGGTPGLGGRSFSQAGTALILSQVGEAIGAKILPFADAVRLDTVGESGFNPTVTFEKQISSDLFVIVIYDTASAENVEIIQWQAAKNWVIQFTRDSEQADTYLINAIDARFRKRFEGRW